MKNCNNDAVLNKEESIFCMTAVSSKGLDHLFTMYMFVDLESE